jgi:hypothetical protein
VTVQEDEASVIDMMAVVPLFPVSEEGSLNVAVAISPILVYTDFLDTKIV